MITTAIIGGTLTWLALMAYEVSTNPTLTPGQLGALAAFYALTWPAILLALLFTGLGAGLAQLLVTIRNLIAG